MLDGVWCCTIKVILIGDRPQYEVQQDDGVTQDAVLKCEIWQDDEEGEVTQDEAPGHALE